MVNKIANIEVAKIVSRFRVRDYSGAKLVKIKPIDFKDNKTIQKLLEDIFSNGEK